MAKVVTTEEIRRFEREILEELTEDYLGLWDVARLVRSEWDLEDASEVRATTMTLLSDLLEEGLVRTGLAKDDGTFEEWNLHSGDGMSVSVRIREEWEAIGGMPSLGDVTWFDLTPKGKRLVS